MRSLLDIYRKQFCAATAAEYHHHSGSGGLANHTAEVIDWALRLFDEFGDKMFGITAENVYIAAVLHDLAKINQYRLVPPENVTFEYDRGWQFEPDIWVINEANRFGLQLNYDEMMGIIQAHGGWSKMRTPMNQLGVLIHLADMISSQLLK
jgi:23S rRNA maturation-related 3'-5' exoribonuclease YhaM